MLIVLRPCTVVSPARPGFSAAAVVQRRRDPPDLAQLGDVLQPPVSRAIGHREAEVVIVALRAVHAVQLVGVLPVLQRVHHHVTRLPVHAEALEELAQPLGRGEVQVEPPLLIGDAIA
jgi:hypothetical protein